ncbi:methylmalonyl Co-A mutase-associated GTPase MeaB [Halobellus rubicundus]|uniref:Methylmalonyl Co-A mutase-associated GTPase MeaB n=1 Tax=Halobellus rubicundus TaxID=2996466 RepID=A0ABD5MAM0_9EURY
MGGDDPEGEDVADPDATEARIERLVERLLAGEHRALARAITLIENRAPGHRDLVARLHGHAGDAAVVGVTGSPGAGKSTLVDKLARAYRDRGQTVGIVAVDPSSPYSGGSVLGDRIRMGASSGDMDVFVRSMSARGRLGGLSTATTEAITALDAFGKDVVVVETVGAGQSEVDIVRTADTVAVLVQPGSGDDVQMLKAGILEIGDVFVVNKADMDGAARTVAELEEMLHRQRSAGEAESAQSGHHGPGMASGADAATREDGSDATAEWDPRIVETVATTGEGVDDLLDALDGHDAWLRESGAREAKARQRHGAEIRRLVRSDLTELAEAELARRGGLDALAERVQARETDPYTVADGVVEPIRECVKSDEDGSGDGGDPENE